MSLGSLGFSHTGNIKVEGFHSTKDNSLNRCASMLSSAINASDVVTTLNSVALMITSKMSYYVMVFHNF